MVHTAFSTVGFFKSAFTPGLMPLRADNPGAAALKVCVTRACSSDTSIVSVGAIKKILSGVFRFQDNQRRSVAKKRMDSTRSRTSQRIGCARYGIHFHQADLVPETGEKSSMPIRAHFLAEIWGKVRKGRIINGPA